MCWLSADYSCPLIHIMFFYFLLNSACFVARRLGHGGTLHAGLRCFRTPRRRDIKVLLQGMRGAFSSCMVQSYESFAAWIFGFPA